MTVKGAIRNCLLPVWLRHSRNIKSDKWPNDTTGPVVARTHTHGRTDLCLLRIAKNERKKKNTAIARSRRFHFRFYCEMLHAVWNNTPGFAHVEMKKIKNIWCCHLPGCTNIKNVLRIVVTISVISCRWNRWQWNH